MERKLKVSRHFVPCATDDDDELYRNGIFVFNITKMVEYVQKNNLACEEVVVKDFSRGSSKINEEHVASVDVSKPIIVAEIAPGRLNVLDGNHRIEKARRLRMVRISAHRLSPEQHMQFLTTEKGYRAYIEYWNGKLRGIG